MAQALIVAHRGDATHAPENTLVAFERAIQAGADAIELDVQESSDGEVFVFHDLYLGRTVAGHAPFGALTARQVRGLDVGALFSEQFAGTRIPTLREVLDCWQGKTRFEIELKQPSRALAHNVLRAIRDFGIAGSVELTSGHLPLLSWLRESQPDVELGTWFSPAPDWMRPNEHAAHISAYADLLGLRVVHLPMSVMTEPLVAHIHNAGRLAHGANLNDEQALRAALRLGVDRLTTNGIALAASIIKRSVLG